MFSFLVTRHIPGQSLDSVLTIIKQREMLARLTTNLRERQGAAAAGLEVLDTMEEHATVIADDNCTVCPFGSALRGAQSNTDGLKVM